MSNRKLTNRGFIFLGYAECSSIGIYFNEKTRVLAHDFGLIDYYRLDDLIKKEDTAICGINKEALKLIKLIKLKEDKAKELGI